MLYVEYFPLKCLRHIPWKASCDYKFLVAGSETTSVPKQTERFIITLGEIRPETFAAAPPVLEEKLNYLSIVDSRVKSVYQRWVRPNVD